MFGKYWYCNFLARKGSLAKILFFVSIVVAVFGLSLPSSLIAYSPNNTHPDLTEEMAELHNLLSGSYAFGEKEIKWLRKGAENEDKPPRWINHFYDPVHQIAWDGSNFGYLTKEEGLNVVAGLTSERPMSSIEWVVDQNQQAKYGNQYGNQTWQKALDAYVSGEKKDAFVALGHILHLVEDLSVPDHTRNDPHSGIYGDSSSPYEDYAKEYTNSNKLTIAKNLVGKGVNLMEFTKIQDAFEYLAKYSNENFFSEDTIRNEEYENPNINILEKVVHIIGTQKIGFIYDKEKGIYLAHKNKLEKYSLNNTSHVLPSYVSLLFPQAVLTGASVIELFFKEAERYKQNPELLEPIVFDSRSSIKEIVIQSPKLLALNVANFTDNIAVDSKIFAVNTYKKSKETVSVAVAAASDVISGAVALFSGENKKIGGEAIALNVIVPKDISNPSSVPMVSVQTTEDAPINSLDNLEKLKMAEEMLKDIQDQLLMLKEEKKEDRKTLVPVIIAEAPSSRTVLDEKTSRESSSRLVFVGTLYPGFGGGGAPVKIVAVSVDEEQIPESEEEEEELEMMPSPVLSISQCDYSLAMDGCLLATTTVVFSWSAVSDAEHYSLSKNGEYATTTEISFTAEIADYSDYTFSVSAINSATSSATTTQTVSVATIPIAINEVAWMGTSASHYDEWLEIKNNTNYSIDLSQWVLESQDGAPYIQLSGEIGPKEYLVLERRVDTIIISEESTTYGNGLSQWAMHNDGEEILLSYASTTLDKTPAISGGDWTAGDNTSSTSRKTMERIDSKQSGATTTNWATWGTGVDFIKSGTDTDDNPIFGTPGKCNSVSFANINGGLDLEENLTLEEDGCFYVAGGFNTTASSTLTIEAGVQVSIYLDDLVVKGVLDVNGEKNNPVVFDSFSGAKSNNEIKINGNAGTSTMENVVISNTDGMILDYGASLEITNAEFINNETGITLYRESSVIIENTSFASTTDEVLSAYNGSSISMASSTINNVFEADAVYIDYSTLSMSSTTISNVLEGDAVSVYGSTVSISSSAISEVLDRDGIGAYYSVVSISDSTISNIPDGNGIGLYNSTTTLSNVVVEDTEYDGIYVGGGEISGNATVNGVEVEY